MLFCSHFYQEQIFIECYSLNSFTCFSKRLVAWDGLTIFQPLEGDVVARSMTGKIEVLSNKDFLNNRIYLSVGFLHIICKKKGINLTLLFSVFTWRHGGHVGVQNNGENKSFGNLILLLCKTLPTFCHCFEHQHSRLIAWMKTKNVNFSVF